MIISASRRTDIPALYPEWFINRLKAGEVLVPNPYNRKKISRIQLSPDTIYCLLDEESRTSDSLSEYDRQNGIFLLFPDDDYGL